MAASSRRLARPVQLGDGRATEAAGAGWDSCKGVDFTRPNKGVKIRPKILCFQLAFAPSETIQITSVFWMVLPSLISILAVRIQEMNIVYRNFALLTKKL